MGILDFLKRPAFRDPVVGNLLRQGRYWRGQISLGSERDVPMLLAGSRAAPDEAGLGLARELGPPLDGVDTVEIAYRTDWDTEHTLGARFQGWALIELNGSVI